MSAKVKLSGALPGNEEINGLDAIADKLVEAPETLWLVLGWIDVKDVKDVTDTGERIPTTRFRRIEVVSKASEAPQELRNMVLRLAEERTGKTPLPIDAYAAATDGLVD